MVRWVCCLLYNGDINFGKHNKVDVNSVTHLVGSV